MSSFRLTRHYDFHGVGISIDAPSCASMALHSRLRKFAAAESVRPDVTFEYHFVGREEDHLVQAPTGGARPVYESPVGVVVYVDAEDRLYLDCGERVRIECVPSTGKVLASVLESEAGNEWLISRPMFTLPFVELMKRRRLYNLHAAGLGIGGRGGLFAGVSGAGKSTLTVSLLKAGFGLLSDDMVFLRQGPEGLRVTAFPDEIDLTEETLGMFPELSEVLARPLPSGARKRQLCPDEVYRAEVVRECRPVLLFFPRVAHTKKSVIKPLDRGEALIELAPNILLTEAASTQAHLDTLARLVTETECYRLETGTDFDYLSALLADMMTRRPSPPRGAASM